MDKESIKEHIIIIEEYLEVITERMKCISKEIEKDKTATKKAKGYLDNLWGKKDFVFKKRFEGQMAELLIKSMDWEKDYGKYMDKQRGDNGN